MGFTNKDPMFHSTLHAELSTTLSAAIASPIETHVATAAAKLQGLLIALADKNATTAPGSGWKTELTALYHDWAYAIHEIVTSNDADPVPALEERLNRSVVAAAEANWVNGPVYGDIVASADGAADPTALCASISVPDALPTDDIVFGPSASTDLDLARVSALFSGAPAPDAIIPGAWLYNGRFKPSPATLAAVDRVAGFDSDPVFRCIEGFNIRGFKQLLASSADAGAVPAWRYTRWLFVAIRAHNAAAIDALLAMPEPAKVLAERLACFLAPCLVADGELFKFVVKVAEAGKIDVVLFLSCFLHSAENPSVQKLFASLLPRAIACVASDPAAAAASVNTLLHRAVTTDLPENVSAVVMALHAAARKAENVVSDPATVLLQALEAATVAGASLRYLNTTILEKIAAVHGSSPSSVDADKVQGALTRHSLSVDLVERLRSRGLVA
jgi:hypothetical protein